jgi:hypothetical protein
MFEAYGNSKQVKINEIQTNNIIFINPWSNIFSN